MVELVRMKKHIQDIPEGSYFYFPWDKNRIIQLVRWEEEDGEGIPIIKEYCQYWTYEQEWKKFDTREESCNPIVDVIPWTEPLPI
jgi:hypothetical protein